MEHTDLYIDGLWREGAGSERFDVLNPATEEVLASVASAEIADADAALDAAQAAFADWAGRKPRERAEVLRKAFELMTARLEDFARWKTARPAATLWAKRPTQPSSSVGSRKKPCAQTG